MLTLDDMVMRRVKRAESGDFVLGKPPERVNSLCRACGINDRCKLYKAHKKVTWALPEVTVCQRFVPVLGFRPPIVGLEKSFNTMRLGKAWTERVAPGTVVALLNTVDSKLLGFARVTHIEVGAFDTMVWAHGADNHLVVNSPKGRNECIEEVRYVLQKSYGKFLTPESKLTVVYCTRIPDAEVRLP